MPLHLNLSPLLRESLKQTTLYFFIEHGISFQHLFVTCKFEVDPIFASNG